MNIGLALAVHWRPDLQSVSILLAAARDDTNKQERAAQDALRVTRENFQAGTGLFLDVLQTQDAVSLARHLEAAI